MTATIVDISQGPRRGSSDAKKQAPGQPTADRTLWRAVVHAGGRFAANREGDRVEWHLAGCREPFEPGTHCNEGLHLTEVVGHPDGHCVVDGRCGRCGERTRSVGTAKKAA